MKNNPRIQAGKRQPAEVTIQAVAKAAGLSLATVSLALNNHPRVATKTAVRVQEIANRLGYRPHLAARQLARSRFSLPGGRVDQVALVFMDRSGAELDGSYLAMLRGAEHEVSSRRATLAFLRVTSDADWGKVEQLQRAGMVDGWLLFGGVDDEAVSRTSRGKQFAVVLGGHQCRQAVPATDVDFEAAGRTAVEQFAALGHRRIGYVGGTLRYPYQQAMLKGFRAALRQHNLDEDDALIRAGEDADGVPREVRLNNLLKSGIAPTAIFGAEIGYGASIISLLRQRELNVPRDLSVIGCEIGSTSRTQAGPTKVELPFAEVGRLGVQLLYQLVEKQGLAAPVARVSPQLTKGWSCDAPLVNRPASFRG